MHRALDDHGAQAVTIAARAMPTLRLARRVPRARAGRLPERRHRRAGAARAAVEAARARARRRARGGPLGRARTASGLRELRRTAAARRWPRCSAATPERGRPHRLDHRRREHRARPALELGRGRRGAHERRGAPGPARAAGGGPRAARGSSRGSSRSTSWPARCGRRTRLVACSHVSWVSGRVVDAAALRGDRRARAARRRPGPRRRARRRATSWAATSTRPPARSGCAAPTAPAICTCARSCAERARRRRWPGYRSASRIPHDALGLRLHPDARRFDHGLPARATRRPGRWPRSSCSAEAGWDTVHEPGAQRSPACSPSAAERGLEVAPRGRSTLVSWRATRTRRPR